MGSKHSSPSGSELSGGVCPSSQLPRFSAAAHHVQGALELSEEFGLRFRRGGAQGTSDPV